MECSSRCFLFIKKPKYGEKKCRHCNNSISDEELIFSKRGKQYYCSVCAFKLGFIGAKTWWQCHQKQVQRKVHCVQFVKKSRYIDIHMKNNKNALKKQRKRTFQFEWRRIWGLLLLQECVRVTRNKKNLWRIYNVLVLSKV